MPASPRSSWRTFFAATSSWLLLASAVVAQDRGNDAHWAWRPVVRATAPTAGDGWARNDVDRFVAARLATAGLTPGPDADRRTLIRRVTFDLLGLPPGPEEIDVFVADPRPDAYERLVERLLASPHYGERMARLWLDVARFGESHGFEHDQLRPNAWRYREWLVDAFNADLPYDAFVRAQLAGDVLGAGEDAVATGFLVAGAYDSVGQSQQSAAMRAVVRQDELEDLVGTTAQAFLGISVHCARCHDHKFDPITQRDYYAFAAALAGVHHGERDVTTAAERAAATVETERRAARVHELEARLRSLEEPVRAAVRAARGMPAADPLPALEWTFDIGFDDVGGGVHATAFGGAQVRDGALVLDSAGAYVATAPLPFATTERTLEATVELQGLDQRGGAAIAIESLDGAVFDAIVFGEREPRRWMAGSEFFRRTQSFGGAEEDVAAPRTVHVAIVWRADGTIAAFRDGVRYGTSYRSEGPRPFDAGAARVLFGLRHEPVSASKLLRGRVHHAALHTRALDDDEIARRALRSGAEPTEAEFDARLSAADRATRAELRAALRGLQAQTAVTAARLAYVVVPSEPEPIHLLERGDPRRPTDRVAPAGVASLPHAELGLAADAPDAIRRARFAAWITAPDQPLFARVIVNRIWQQHFGVGLVDTPSDFGANGTRPTHPELLDALAADFVADGFRLKALHRTLVTSATYRQRGRRDAAAEQVDADARLLWRAPLRRLDAETLRDTMLAVGGRLDLRVGGPSYRDFEITLFGSTHTYVPIEPPADAAERRSLYRTWARGGRQRLLDAFDCPDPSTTAPRRAVTTTPLQALALANDAFVLRMCDALAARVAVDVGPDVAAQCVRVFRLAYGRAPSPDELVAAVDVAGAHGIAVVARAVFGSNEFLHID